MLKKQVVIVGGGWAGIRLVRKLKKLANNQIHITLVSNEPNFRYSAALYRVATGHKEKQAIIPIHELTQDIPGAKFIRTTMANIDPKKRVISLGNGEKLHYDYAVLAIGSVTTYFGIPGIEEHAYSIKTQKELRKFRAHIHQELLEEHAPDKNYVVVGAGPTGVELSAAMASYIKATMQRHGIRHRRVHIELIEAAPRVLPQSHPRASKLALRQLQKLGVKVRLNSKVEFETDTSLVVDGRSIPTKTVVWTAGVSNNPFFAKRANLFTLNNRGKVIVNDHLQVDKHLYVIGDNAVTPFSGLGLTAVHNATYVGNDITKKISGHKNTPAYKPLTPATVVPVGKNWAVFQYKSLVIGGFIAGLIRSIADLVAYNDIAGFWPALKLWTHSGELEEQCVLCKTALIDKQGIIAGLSEPY
jgi:NADH:ubiquinone reductase (H+-translocating)